MVKIWAIGASKKDCALVEAATEIVIESGATRFSRLSEISQLRHPANAIDLDKVQDFKLKFIGVTQLSRHGNHGGGNGGGVISFGRDRDYRRETDSRQAPSSADKEKLAGLLAEDGSTRSAALNSRQAYHCTSIHKLICKMNTVRASTVRVLAHFATPPLVDRRTGHKLNQKHNHQEHIKDRLRHGAS
jgi:hypothetical protein